MPIVARLRQRLEGDPRQGQATDELLHAKHTGTKAVADRWHAQLDLEELL